LPRHQKEGCRFLSLVPDNRKALASQTKASSAAIPKPSIATWTGKEGKETFENKRKYCPFRKKKKENT